MSKISFNNQSENFRELVKQAKIDAQDGVIDSSEKEELFKLASSDGEITNDERLFLQALETDSNVKTLQRGASSGSFKLELDVRSYDNVSEYNKDVIPSTPIPNTSTSDIGTYFFNDIMKDDRITAQKLEQQIFSLDKVKNNPDLYKSILNFTSSLDLNDKEASMYLLQLVKNSGKSNNEVINILNKLTEMSKQTFDPRIGSKRDLIVSALHDVTTPNNIAQRDLGSCAGTCVQAQLAIHNPIEYLNMLDTLAKGNTYRTLQGDQIEPNWTFVNEGSGSDDKTNTHRSLSSKIMQNAIMDFANGSVDFDSTKDQNGLITSQTQMVLSSLLNMDLKAYESKDYSPEQLMTVIKNSNPSRENPIQVSMAYQPDGRDSFHALNLIDIKDGKATFINPWGREEKIPLSELKNKVYGVVASPDIEKLLGKASDSKLAEISKQEEASWGNTAQTMYYGTDGISIAINDDSRRDEILESMNLEQKVQTVKSILNGKTISEEDKKAVLHIMSNLLEGGEAQDYYAFIYFTMEMQESDINKINVSEVFDKVKSDTPLFYETVTQAFTIMGKIDSDLQSELSPFVFDNSENANKALEKIDPSESRYFLDYARGNEIITTKISEAINEKGPGFYRSLNLEQRAKALDALSLGNVDSNDKKAILTILDNTVFDINNDEIENKDKIYKKLGEHLKTQGTNILEILEKARDEDPELANNIATKAYLLTSNRVEKSRIARFILKEPEKAHDFITRLNDPDFAFLLKVADGKKVANDPEVAAQILMGALFYFNDTDSSNREITSSQVTKFISDIASSPNSSKIFQDVLSVLEYNPENQTFYKNMEQRSDEMKDILDFLVSFT